MIESEITHFADSAHRERIGNAVPRKAEGHGRGNRPGHPAVARRRIVPAVVDAYLGAPIVTALAVRGGRGVNWSEQTIGRALARQTFNRKYLVVVPNCIWTGHECDVLAVTENLRLIDVEIKISRADLKADAAKAKWWHQRYVGAPRRVEEHDERGRPIRRRNIYAREFELRTWPPKVWKHYYAMPADIWSDDLLGSLGSPASGVLLLADAGGELRIRVRRPAKPCRGAEPISPPPRWISRAWRACACGTPTSAWSRGSGMTPKRPLIRYHGGKWRLAPWIIQHLPPHRCYVEPFGGGASVLLRKPRAYAEVYNDLDDEIVNLFRVARDDGERLALACELTPLPAASSKTPTTRPPAIRWNRRGARSFAASGFGSAAVTGQSSGFRANSNRSGSTPAHDWMNYPDCLRLVIQRLRGVVIEHRDALDCMARHDSPDTLHYVDPPYVHSTRAFRARAHSYRHEMTDDQHVALAAAARPAGHGGPERLPQRAVRPPLCRLDAIDGRSHADGARPRIESLWLSPAVPAPGLLLGDAQLHVGLDLERRNSDEPSLRTKPAAPRANALPSWSRKAPSGNRTAPT